MRQVDRDELRYLFTSAMRFVRPGTRRELLDARVEVRQRAEATVGTVMADALARVEVLSSHPPAGSPEAFSRPMARMLGEEVASGAPMLDEAT